MTACCGTSDPSAKYVAEFCCCCADQIPWAIPGSNTTPEGGGHRIAMNVHDATEGKKESVEEVLEAADLLILHTCVMQY